MLRWTTLFVIVGFLLPAPKDERAAREMYARMLVEELRGMGIYVQADASGTTLTISAEGGSLGREIARSRGFRQKATEIGFREITIR